MYSPRIYLLVMDCVNQRYKKPILFVKSRSKTSIFLKADCFFFFQSVTENGFAVKGEDDMPIQEALKDHDRVHYFQGITAALVNAIHEDKIDIRSYIPWSRFFLSLLKNFGGNLQTRSY